MSDIFGRIDQVHAGGLSSDSMFMTFPDLPGGGLGLIIQSVGISYRQPVRRIVEIGPGLIPIIDPISGEQVFGNTTVCDADPTGDEDLDKVIGDICSSRVQATYYIAGRPEGRFTLARIFGPNVIQSAFYKKFGNPCVSNNISLSGRVGCNGTEDSTLVHWDIAGIVLDAVDFAVTAQEMVIQEQSGGQFIGLYVSP